MYIPFVNHSKGSCEPLIPCTLPFLFIDKIRQSQFTVGFWNTFVYLFQLFRRNIPRPQIFSNNSVKKNLASTVFICLKVHKIEIFFGFDFEICIISLLVM